MLQSTSYDRIIRLKHRMRSKLWDHVDPFSFRVSSFNCMKSCLSRGCGEHCIPRQNGSRADGFSRNAKLVVLHRRKDDMTQSSNFTISKSVSRRVCCRFSQQLKQPQTLGYLCPDSKMCYCLTTGNCASYNWWIGICSVMRAQVVL